MRTAGLGKAAFTGLLMLALPGCGDETTETRQPPPSVEVGVVTLKATAAKRTTTLPGRVVALSTAEIRPQVDGIIRKISFREGRKVAEGDILYEIEDGKYRAAHAAAVAALKRAQAVRIGAKTTFDRSQELAKVNAISTQDLDDARSTLMQADADVEAEQAALDTARINLDNTKIRAPISGRIGVSSASLGALATENQSDALTTIRQVDPIYVDLAESSANLLNLREQVESGLIGRSGDGPPSVTLTLENGRPYKEEGKLALAEIVVSESMGTFTMRASFPNPEEMLMPGMFVTATVDLGEIQNAFLAPQRAVQRDASGAPFVYVVSPEGKADRRVLETVGTSGSDWIVTSGLKDGDKVVVDGFSKFSAGAPVKAVDAVIDADGVVRQTVTTDDGAANGGLAQ